MRDNANRLLLSLLLPLLMLPASIGQTPGEPSDKSAGSVDRSSRPASPLDESPEQLYAMASTMMRRGLRYEKAAEYLKTALQNDPTNYRYAMALGVAYKGRIASLASAIASMEFDQRNKEKYNRWQTEWSEAQKDQDHPRYGTPPPEPPPILTTPDDRKLFLLSREDGIQKLHELAPLALDAWDTGLTQAKTREEIAEAESLRGWGMLFLRKHLYFPYNPKYAPLWKRLRVYPKSVEPSL